MKKTLLIAILFIPFLSFAQDTVGMKLPFKDGKLIYEGVIDAPGKSKMDLYTNARQWFIDYFKRSKDVIQNEDKAEGRIIGKGTIFVYLYATMIKLKYDDLITVQIDVKDNKYRYRIYDFVVNLTSENLFGVKQDNNYTAEELVGKIYRTYKKIWASKKQCHEILESEDSETKSTIDSLIKAMATTAKADSF